MSSSYRSQVFASSSWGGLQEVGAMNDADAMIAAGESTLAWPTTVGYDRIFTAGGLRAPGRACVAGYADGSARALGVVGKVHRATDPGEWRSCIRAAVAAGASPTGVFQIDHGARVVATFDVGGNGIRTQLVLADSFDGSLKLTAGTTVIRMFCANQMASVMKNDGAGMAALRHTANLETKVKVLQEAIGETIATGEKVRATYHAAEQIALTQAAADAVFDKLFPAGEPGDRRGIAKADRARDMARAAMALPVNHVASAGTTMATLWNAATYLVDRTIDGAAKPTRGDADPMESMLFGARAKRIQEVQGIIEVIMASGEIERMTVNQARSHGVDDRQMARSIIEEMLAN